MSYRNGTPPERIPTDARKFRPEPRTGRWSRDLRRHEQRYMYLTAREWLRAVVLVLLVGPALYVALVVLMLAGGALVDLMGAA